MGVAKHSWLSWPCPLPLCLYKAFSKVGNYDSVSHQQKYLQQFLDIMDYSHWISDSGGLGHSESQEIDHEEVGREARQLN